MFGTSTANRDENGFFPLRYDEKNACDITVNEKGGFVSNICVHRPCAHPALHESIFSVLLRGPFVLFAPGGSTPVIAQSHVSDRLPQDMIDTQGQPLLVGHAEDISPSLFD